MLTEADDPANSAYVENAMFRKSRAIFATLNITGSNNDGASWGTPLPADAANYPSQADERAARAQANGAWLNEAFATATRTHAVGVVLLFQADMWDTAEPTLSGFDALVQQIGVLAARYDGPVLLLEGDSHLFRVDHPFTPGDPLYGKYDIPVDAPNLTRVVVQGSTNCPHAYLRLHVDPASDAVFSGENVVLPLSPACDATPIAGGF